MKAISGIASVLYCIHAVFIAMYTDKYFPGMGFFAEMLICVDMIMIGYIRQRDPYQRPLGLSVPIGIYAIAVAAMGYTPYHRDVPMDLVVLTIFPLVVALSVSVVTVRTFAMPEGVKGKTCSEVFETFNSVIVLIVGAILVYVSYGKVRPEDYALMVIGSYVVVLGAMLTAAQWLSYQYE